MDEKTKERCIDLFSRGYEYSEIGKKVNYSGSYVYQVLWFYFYPENLTKARRRLIESHAAEREAEKAEKAKEKGGTGKA